MQSSGDDSVLSTTANVTGIIHFVYAVLLGILIYSFFAWTAPKNLQASRVALEAARIEVQLFCNIAYQLNQGSKAYPAGDLSAEAFAVLHFRFPEDFEEILLKDLGMANTWTDLDSSLPGRWHHRLLCPLVQL